MPIEIQIDPHTLERAEERGTSEDEIRDVINTGFTVPAKHKRMGKAKVYQFRKMRHGQYYEQKRVEVIYTRDDGRTTTATTHAPHGKWEEQQ